MSLRHNRCQFHPEREAVARCPRCGRHFCAECVTEQAGVMRCGPCLSAETPGAGSTTPPPNRPEAALGLGLALAAGVAALTGIFLLLVATLANLGPR